MRKVRSYEEGAPWRTGATIESKCSDSHKKPLRGSTGEGACRPRCIVAPLSSAIPSDSSLQNHAKRKNDPFRSRFHVLGILISGGSGLGCRRRRGGRCRFRRSSAQ